MKDELDRGVVALFKSVTSIIDDGALDETAKLEAVAETFEQYHTFTDAVLKAGRADDDDGDEAMDETEDPALCDMSDDERKTAETKLRHERAARMRGRLHKQQESDDMDSMIEVAKRVIAGVPTRITKNEWFAEIDKRAQAARGEDETKEKAFASYLETPDGKVLYAALKAAPADTTEARQATVTPPTPTPTPSYTKLMAKAEALRESDGKLTEAQSFAKVYTDPRNADLVQAAKREHSERVAKGRAA